MDHFRMRRSSFTPAFRKGNQEPMIVVEETGAPEEDDPPSRTSSPRNSLDIESPLNPYLLSPWRDPRGDRKHSLPSQQVTEGITASQVRRLSERGGEGSGPTPREAAFLATLSQAPAPTGRRHSVVTISKVPTTLFGRGRRESVAAIPAGSRVLGPRRDSTTSQGPPSTDPRGSIHNLQLDIMDDILQARKARMKLWNTSSEKVCEVQTVDETGPSSPIKYTNRRFSDFIGSSSTPKPTSRRASELPPIVSPSFAGPSLSAAAGTKRKKSGITFTNTDLKTIISSLASSAMEINKMDDPPAGTSGKSKGATTSSNTLHPDAKGVKSSRSNSFDASILHNAKQMISGDDKNATLSGWFDKRHKPVSRRKSVNVPKQGTAASFSKDVLDKFRTEPKETKETKKPKERFGIKWDTKSAIVEAQVIGNAIEGFLRKSSGSTSKGAVPKEARSKKTNSSSKSSFWFSKGEESDSGDTCDSSLCSTLKDLFVK